MSMLMGLAITAVGVAVLGKVLLGGLWQSTKSARGSRGSRVIEIDEYEVLDESQDLQPSGRRVRIDDGDI